MGVDSLYFGHVDWDGDGDDAAAAARCLVSVPDIVRRPFGVAGDEERNAVVGLLAVGEGRTIDIAA